MSGGRSPIRISGPNEALRSLECARIEIVDPLGDVVGELVRQREADAERRAVVADDIDAGDFRLLAGVLREGGRDERRARRHRHGAVALVEPFRLHAGLAFRRLAAFEPHAEHLHGVGQRFLAVGAELLVHGVARRGGAEMRQSGAGEMEMRRVGMVDRRQKPALLVGGVEIDVSPRPLRSMSATSPTAGAAASIASE